MTVREALIVQAVPGGRRLASVVYDVIKERLLEGGWQAGASIGVEALRTELGVSKQPVMDALRRLSADGLVEIIPQVGCRVPRYSTQEASDFFALFATLEGEAAGLAARRRSADQIPLLRAVNADIAAIDPLADGGTRVHQYLVLNRRFHSLVLAMAHSTMVVRLSSRMWDACDLLLNTTGDSLPLADEVQDRHADHEQIIAALQAGDAAAASEQMRDHILRNVDMLERARASASLTG